MPRRAAYLGMVAVCMLALIGCTSTPPTGPDAQSTAMAQAAESARTSESAAETTFGSSMSPSSSSSASLTQYTKVELSNWADEKLQQWMDDINEGWEDVVMDIQKPADFLKWYPTDPHGHIKSFQAAEYGHLLITLKPYKWESSAEMDLAYVGSNTMLRVGERDRNLQSVTVMTDDGKHTFTATRKEWPPHGN